MKICSLATTLLLVLSTTTLAYAVRVSDGDTITVEGVKYRLWGIDAPERRQVCDDGWRGGLVATTALRDLVEGHAVTCEVMLGKERWGRLIGLCRADGVDLQAEMVKAGMAYAFIRYSRDYVDLEEQAKVAGLGVHAHQCEKPWEWRAKGR